MSVECPTSNIASIQCLRGIAAMMVVVHHLSNQLGQVGATGSERPVLAAGVDIFFVISGFIMWLTTATRPTRTARQFVRDRIVRIVPLYWFVTACVAIMLLIAPQVFRTSTWNTEHVLKSFLFVASLHPKTDAYQPLLIPGWTLNLEMFFYAVFALTMMVGGRSMRVRALLLLGSLVGISTLGLSLRPTGAVAFYTSTLVLEFGAGVLIALVFLKGIRVNRWVGAFVALSGMAMLVIQLSHPLPGPRAVSWGIPAALLVGGAVLGSVGGSKPLERLGDWSYSLYLTHVITLAAVVKFWLMAGGGNRPWLFSVLALSGAVLAAALTYRYIEQPLTRLAKRLVGGRVDHGQSPPQPSVA